MPKGPQGQKRKATKVSERPSARAISRWENEGGATEKFSRKLPDDPIAREGAIMPEATKGKSKPKKTR